MLLNCGVGEDSWDCKEIQPVHPKGDQSWVFIGRTDAEAETTVLWPPDVKLTHWKRPWCWERLEAGEEGDNRGWDGWMASLTRWTWVWVGSGSCWWTGRPGMLQSKGSQRVRHNWATELNWYHVTFIHVSVDTWLDVFCILHIVINATMNAKVYLSVQNCIFIFFTYIQMSWITGLYSGVIFSLLMK